MPTIVQLVSAGMPLEMNNAGTMQNKFPHKVSEVATNSFFDVSAATDAIRSSLAFDFDLSVATISILLACSTFAFLLRILIRTRNGKNESFAKHDIAMLGAFPAYIMTALLTLLALHGENVSLETERILFPLNISVEIVRYANASYTLVMMLVKTALALYALGTLKASTSYKLHCTAIRSMIVVQSTIGSAYLMANVASCFMISRGGYWWTMQPCFTGISLAWDMTNCISTITFAAMGCIALRRSKMDLTNAIWARALLALGFTAISASCVRMAIDLRVTDNNRSGVALIETATVESGLCLIAASLMTLLLDNARESESRTDSEKLQSYQIVQNCPVVYSEKMGYAGSTSTVTLLD